MDVWLTKTGPLSVPASVVIHDGSLSAVKMAFERSEDRSRFSAWHVVSRYPYLATGVPALAYELREALDVRGLNRVALIGVGLGSHVAQQYALKFPKHVRQLVLVDGSTRHPPHQLSVLIDALERKLPAGLPFRRQSERFDSRPFLHRIRCPTMIVKSQEATEFVGRESEFLAAKLPNAWLKQVDCSVTASEDGLLIPEALESLIDDFSLVPTKRPQKRLSDYLGPGLASRQGNF